MENTFEVDGQTFDSETGELLNEVEQVEVEVIENILPAIVCNGGTHIQTNTEQLKKELIVHLAKYDVEVTQETEKEASKMATELNKLAKDLNTKRLAVGKEIKKPADQLKKSIDELIELVQKSRTKLLDGVDEFKQKRFTIIRHKLEQERDRLFDELNVSDSYRFLDIEVLVVEGSLGNSDLTKKAKESLQSMVRAIKALEDAVTIRTLQLKVTCLDAGLQFPIELREVESFIKEADYDARLKLMIDSRLEVEAKVKEQAKEQAKKEAEEKEKFRLSEIARVEKEKNDEIARVKREAEEKEQDRLNEIQRAKDEEKEREDSKERERIAEEKRTNKKIVTLEAIFKVEVLASIENEKVLSKFKEKLQKDFDTFVSLNIK